MVDRTELLEAALDGLAEGIALAGPDGQVAFFNKAAESFTGRARLELVGRSVREALDLLMVGGASHWIHQSNQDGAQDHGLLVHLRHRLGHQLPALARVLVLRNDLGSRIGTGVAFHPTERLDALPHGQSSDSEFVGESQVGLEERLEAEFRDFADGGVPFGVLWIKIDQAAELHRSHGARACEAMVEIVERALSHGLRATEEMGRWGDDEFLVISHERTQQMLGAHAELLAGLVKAAEFRWWGDRVPLTVSVGAAQANLQEDLAQLLERARAQMTSRAEPEEQKTTSMLGE